MRILALDQSSRVSGWAIFDDGELVEYGKIDLSKETQIGERLHKLRESIHKMINELNIDKVILEDIYMDGQKINNVQTFKILAEVFGVLFELCIALNIPEAQAWVLEHYNIKPSQDEVDAICIGSHIIYQNINNWEE